MNSGKEYLDAKYWEGLKTKSALAGITLDDNVSQEDFKTYGNRLAERQIIMISRHGDSSLAKSSIVDLGCGIGRIVDPFSKTFSRVVGIDINNKVLNIAKDYVGSSNKVEFIENDGKSIPLPNNSYDYVYCGGVLQHIPDIEVIVNYFYEGLRILKIGGLLNFSIQVWMIFRKGGIQGDRVGAQVRANDIEQILNRTGHELVKIYFDEKDPIPHYNILIKKLNKDQAQKNIESRKKSPYKVSEGIVELMDIRTGIFEDLPSYSKHRGDWDRKSKRQITFFRRNLSYIIKEKYKVLKPIATKRLKSIFKLL